MTRAKSCGSIVGSESPIDKKKTRELLFYDLIRMATTAQPPVNLIPPPPPPPPKEGEPAYVYLEGFSQRNLNEIIEDLRSQIKENGKQDTWKVAAIDPNLVRVKLSEQEKQRKKKEYRTAYGKRDTVIQKRAQRNESEDVKLARKEYAKDKEVKERKMELARVRRQILNFIKEEHPDIYTLARGKFFRPVPRKKKASKKVESKDEVIGVDLQMKDQGEEEGGLSNPEPDNNETTTKAQKRKAVSDPEEHQRQSRMRKRQKK